MDMIRDFLKSFSMLTVLSEVVSLIVAAFMIFIIIYINTLNKKKQIGILKAVGITPQSIMFSYMLISLFYVAFGVLVGLLLLAVIFVYLNANPLVFYETMTLAPAVDYGMIMQSIISLIIVSFILNTNPAASVSGSTSKLAVVSRPLSISEAVVSEQGAYFFKLHNSTGENITIVGIEIGTNPIASPNKTIPHNAKEAFLIDSSDYCLNGQLVTQEIIVSYTNEYDLEKRQKILFLCGFPHPCLTPAWHPQIPYHCDRSQHRLSSFHHTPASSLRHFQSPGNQRQRDLLLQHPDLRHLLMAPSVCASHQARGQYQLLQQ